MVHDIEHPWGTGEQIVGETADDIYDRIDEKHTRWNPVKDPGLYAAPESTLNRQAAQEAFNEDPKYASILGPAELTKGRLDHRL